MYYRTLFFGASLAACLSACSKSGGSSSTSPTTTTDSVITYAGNGSGGFINGPAATAEFNSPRGLAFDSQGNLYVGDQGNNVIRKITPSGTVSTFCGNGTAGYKDGGPTVAEFSSMDVGMTIDAAGNIFLPDDYNLRKITTANGTVSTVAGDGQPGFGLNDGQAVTNEANAIRGVAVDSKDNVYAVDDGSSKIRIVSANGTVATFAGNGVIGFQDGSAASAEFNSAAAAVIDAQGNVYVADQMNNRIRKITPSGTVSTFAGNGMTGNVDGSASTAEFNQPLGLCIDQQGNLYVGDAGDYRIRKITPSGTVTTVAGNGTFGLVNGSGQNAEFGGANGMAVDAKGNVYIADAGNHCIREIILH